MREIVKAAKSSAIVSVQIVGILLGFATLGYIFLHSLLFIGNLAEVHLFKGTGGIVAILFLILFFFLFAFALEIHSNNEYNRKVRK